jgi:hypothetical protein
MDGNIEYIILKKSNPDYATIVNQLKIRKTYRFKVSYTFPRYELLSVHELNTHKIITKVLALLSLELEKINGFYEIVLEGGNEDHRVFIPTNRKDQISVDNVYMIEYEKTGGSNYYVVTKIEGGMGG